MNIERERLLANVLGPDGWKHWGPYLSERQWGTVREDYSPGGTAWEYFPHDHARSRAYRWGEDGIGGISDAEQLVCLSLALWNGADPILKERMFGLTNAEGNHGEDVKEHYFYLDATPSHSYLKMLYKYPHRAFPYADLLAENARRGTDVPEYELLDTGIFAENRYFDVFIEYAQVEPGDILMKVTVWNRGPTAMLHLIPQLVLRNTWSWEPGSEKPLLKAAEQGAIDVEPAGLGVSRLYFDRHAEVLRKIGETGAAAARQNNAVRRNRAREPAQDDGFGHQGGHLHPDIAYLPAERRLAHGPHQPFQARIGKMASEEKKALAHATFNSLLRRAMNSFRSLKLSATCVASKLFSFSVFSRSIRRGKTFTMPSGARVKSSGAVSQAKTMEGTRHLPACAKTLVARLSESP